MTLATPHLMSAATPFMLVVAMVSGKQLTENTRAGGISGVVVIWSGLAILWLIWIFVHRKLVRH